jgi:hypothetical protein
VIIARTPQKHHDQAHCPQRVAVVRLILRGDLDFLPGAHPVFQQVMALYQRHARRKVYRRILNTDPGVATEF